jgi:L-lactate dehydrogenase complex protein LldE
MRVALFSTCIVDQVLPDIGEAVLTVLERLGITAELPRGQTCCGQPFFNSGYRVEARKLALATAAVLAPYDAVVVPSGSCAAMLKVQYPALVAPTDPDRSPLEALAAKTFEFTEFLVHKLGVERLPSGFRGKVTYHDGCHMLRELGIRQEPRTLLAGAEGCQLTEMKGSDSCCGFGGTFSVKFDGISGSMGRAKADAILATGADAVVSCDPSCMLQIAGVLEQRGAAVRALHLAQLLAEEPDQ